MSDTIKSQDRLVSDWETFSYTGRIKQRPTEYLQRDPDKQIPEAFAAFAEPLDEMEEVNEKIYLTHSIYNATGEDLDRFGGYVGLERNLMTDDVYRQEILRRKFTQGGSGTEADIARLAQAVTNFAELTFIEHYPAAFIMHLSGTSIPTDICEVLDNAAMGGVRAYATHDYGTGGFALAGINTSAGEALQVAPATAMQAGTGNEVMGLNRGQAYIPGSRMANYAQVGAGRGGILQANDGLLSTDTSDYIYVGVPDYSNGGSPANLCGAMPKGD